MFKKIFFLVGLFMLFGYQFNKQNDKWIVGMKQETNDSIFLDFSYVNPNLVSLDRVPVFKEKVIRTYKGVPANDSIGYYGNFEEALQFYWDLYKANEYDKTDYLKLVSKTSSDTLLFSKTHIKQGFISIIGFYKNKQFIIADANRNQRFDDDIKYEFDINFRKYALDSIALLNKLPHTDYSYDWYNYNNGKIQTYKRKFILFPSLDLQHLPLSKKEVQYCSSFRFKDYWKGEQKLNNITYEFYYQALYNTFGAIYIKPKTTPFSKDENFNRQFMHYSDQTIAIGGGYYKIDSINSNISKLYLRKVEKEKVIVKKEQAVGSYFKDRVVEDLENGHFSINSVLKKRKYTLIDYWGTWCEPCVKMIPELVKFQNKFSSKVSVVSIAYNLNKKTLKEYTRDKKMNWTNGFVSSINKKNWIAETIQAFPTFILLDSDGKILLIGSSPEEFAKIEDIIK